MTTNFIDFVKIFFSSGRGGDGSAHLRRVKFNPFGGPDGGNGGKGGSIIIKGNKQLWTLLHLKYQKHIKAKRGENGSSNNKTGIDGEDIIVEVPIGTIIKDAETNKIDYEINEDGEEFVLLEGGNGGGGNTNFKSSTNQTPKYAQKGKCGEEAWKIIELKLLADVGLVGFPNAGKSTLISTITNAKPKIANYPFTTLIPNLGIVKYRDFKSFVIADIPGIIEGAAEGKGLGHRFLKHIEKNSILLLMIPVNSQDIKKEYKILLSELSKFNPLLTKKKRIIALTKTDLVEEKFIKKQIIKIPKTEKIIAISAVAQKGLNELKDLIWAKLN